MKSSLCKNPDGSLAEHYLDFLLINANFDREDTKPKYKAAYRGFEEWQASQNSSIEFPVQTNCVLKYLKYHKDNGKGHATATTIRSAIRKIHEIAGEANPTADESIRKFMENFLLENKGSKDSKKEPEENFIPSKNYSEHFNEMMKLLEKDMVELIRKYTDNA